MLNQVYNPDVLTCIANLSSDEVFTPPSVVNQMLDTLPSELWKDEKVTFLDPVSKSGVFLREITKRLIDGLEGKIPNLEERIEHILRKQVFGIGITELTSLISRRSLYCSKYANGKYSIVQFDDEQGNLKYFETEHTWESGSCKYCGVKKEIYDRGEELESYSYSFIHSENPEKLFNMKFDVIIGNPPYQMNDGGGTGSSAVPIYDKFVQTSKKLNPRFLTMIIPSRWYSGGRGLDSFRSEMLNDKRLSVLCDFPNSSDCFSGVEIKGGVCYFLWERDFKGDCLVKTHKDGKVISESRRALLEKGLDSFIRYNESISIIQKVQSLNEEKFSKIISSNDPFGFDVREKNSYKRVKPKFKLKPFPDSISFYYNGWSKKGKGFIDKNQINKNVSFIEDKKIFIPKAWGNGDLNNDWIKPIIVEKNSCCTETYLMIGPFRDDKKIKNIISYMNTKFFHLLLLMMKNTQNAMKKVYSLIPIQNFEEEWNDEKLYKKYDLNQIEIDFIESMVKEIK